MTNKKILVPVDFSTCSINALKYAISIAKRMQAELLLMHAFSVPVTHGEIGASSVVKGLAEGIEEDVYNDFKQLRNDIPELNEVPYNTIIKHAYVTDATISLVNTADIDMVIMGTKGASGIEEVIVGTNAYSIIKHVSVPVLAIPEKSKIEKIKNIALASDYKEVNEETLEPLKLINRLFGTEIHVIHISDNKNIATDEAEEAKKLERYFKGVPHHYHLIVNQDVEKGIESYVKTHEIDILALIPRRHNLFDKIFGGSDSKKIIFHSEIPFLALPE